MRRSQSQEENSLINNSSFNSMNRIANQPYRPHTMSGSSIMPGQPGMVGNNGLIGKQCMMGNQEMMENQGFMGQKIIIG